MGSWLAQYFFNPSFVLPGAALVAAPIIIHLINRLRFRRVRFAAMEFLLQSEQQNRRRILMEQLLLLLLRVLIVLAAVALISRLILDPAQMSLFRGARAHHVVLLDDSGSMLDQQSDGTAFDEALGVVRKLVSEGARRPDTQRFTLVLLSRPDEPLFADRDVNEAFLNELAAKLENARSTHQSLELLDGLKAAERLFADERAMVRQLHVLSDFRRQDWIDEQATVSVIESLDDAGIDVNLVRLVGADHENLAITQLTGDVQVAAAGVPQRFRIAVKNFGEAVARDVRVSVRIDGNRLPLALMFDKIEAGEEVSQIRDLTFDQSGHHSLHVSLDADTLDADNERFLAFDIAEANPVLIIDGSPDGSSGQYIADALASDPQLTGLAPLVDTVRFLRTQALDRYRSIFMVNVPQLPADAVQPLREFASHGGGLVWFVGDLVNSTSYNDVLFDGGANGLFPVPLGPSREQLSHNEFSSPGPDLVLADHPAFGVFQGQDNPFIESVRIDEYLPVAESWTDAEGNVIEWSTDDNKRTDGISTIARLRNRDPIAFEHRYQGSGGRIVTFLTSAGPEWNNWARNPSFVITQLELQKHVARPHALVEQRVVGEPIALLLPASEYLETVEITAPESTGGRITRLKAAPVETDPEGASADEADASGIELMLATTFPQTDSPGVYRVKLVDQSRVENERWLAYNAPIDESDLELAPPDELHQRLGETANVRIQEPGTLEWIEGRDVGQEVRQFLLVSLFLLLIAEQLLAWKLSYHPRIAGATA